MTQFRVTITDGVDASIEPKIRRIGDAANKTHASVLRLQAELNRLNATGLQRLSAATNNHSAAALKAAQAQQRMAQSLAATRAAQANANAAQSGARTALLQTAQARHALTAAQNNAAASAQRLLAAQNAAAASTLRLQQAQQRALQSTMNLKNGTDLLGQAFAYIGIYGLIRGIVTLSDAYVNMSNKLRIASSSQAHNNQLMSEMFDLANRTRSDVGATTQAFVRFDRAMQNAGRSQQDTIRLTETVNKALTIGGATATEARSALLQLSQAFNAGRLNGDEFRSVAENMPIVLDYLAIVMKKNVGELKDLGAQGKITADVMIQAFDLMQQRVDAIFATTTPTISQAWTVLRNNVIQFWGELDRGVGIGATIANTLMFIATNLDRLAWYAAAAGVALAGMWVAATVGSVAATAGIGRFAAALLLLRGAIIRTGIGALIILAGELAYQISVVVEKVGGLGNAFSLLKDVAVEVWERIVTAAGAIPAGLSGVWEGIKAGFLAMIAVLQRAWANFLHSVVGGLKSMPTSIMGVSTGVDAALQAVGNAAIRAGSAYHDTESAAKAAGDAAKASFGAASKAITDAQKPLKSVNALLGAINNNAQSTGNSLLRPQGTPAPGFGAGGAGGGKGKKGGGGKSTVDAYAEMIEKMDQELELLKLLPREREIERQVQDKVNSLREKGINLSAQEIELLREKITTLEAANRVAEAEQQLMEQSVYKREKFIDQMKAINRLLSDPESGFTKADAMMSVAQTELGQYLEHLPEMVNARVEQFRSMYQQVDALRQADLISEQSASAARMQLWAAEQKAKTQVYSDFFGGIAQLASSENEKLARIGRAAAITQTIINTYQSATAAYAAMAGIPVIGPALGIAAAAAAVAAGMANVAAIRAQASKPAGGYMSGGYTGDLGRGEVAGVVHGREYVMDAGATSRIGTADLDALRRGAASVQRHSDNQVTPAASRGMNTGDNEGGAPVINLRIINVLDPSLLDDYIASDSGEQTIMNVLQQNSDTVRRIASDA